MKKKIINNGHFLLGARLDNWLHLLWQNRRVIEPSKIPQVLYTTMVSIILFPFALIEMIIFAVPIARTKIKKGPVCIVGFWRSGTTYLQNLMSKDKNFGWFDPVCTLTFSNCIMFRPIMAVIMKNALKTARPMDNMQYRLDLPMEEVFGHDTISSMEFTQMVAFPRRYEEYIKYAFVHELTEQEQRRFFRTYDYLLRKITWLKGGKPLLLKSPDNTGRMIALKKKYPNAKFLNIYRNPYAVVMSTINMFTKMMDIHRLTKRPDDFEEVLEDAIIDVFEHMYRNMFKYQSKLDSADFVEVCYEKFAMDPETELRRIYEELELTGFEDALPDMRKHIESQKDYKKNKFELTERLRGKINARLGFYFEHYGYTMEEN